MRKERECKVCGYKWYSKKKPIRCSNTACRSKIWVRGVRKSRPAKPRRITTKA